MMQKEFLSLKNIQGKDLVPGLHAKLIHMNELTVMHVNVIAGSVLPEHHHVHEQVTSIISGTLEMTVGGETRACNAGDVIVIPSNVPHSARAITDCYLIDAFSPAREDYK